MDMDLRIDLDKLEPAFYSTGWGDLNLGPQVFQLKFGYPIIRQLLDYADNEAYLHLESIMYGLQGNHNCTGLFQVLRFCRDGPMQTATVSLSTGDPLMGRSSIRGPTPLVCLSTLPLRG